MKRLIEKILPAAFAVILALNNIFTATAESAKLGDMIVMRISVSDESTMASLSATVLYDSNAFDLLSYEAPYGTSFCNDTVPGEFTWAAVFDAIKGMDFTEKTDVMNITFIAKDDLENVESQLVFSVTEAYNASLEEVDLSKITVDTTVYADEVLIDEEVSSKTEFVISKYENYNVSSQTAVEDIFQSEPVSSENTSHEQVSGEEENITDTEKKSAESLDSELKSEPSGTDSGLIVSETSNGIVISYDKTEFEEQPPIKIGTPTEPEKEISGKYTVALLVGCVILVVITAVMLIIKRKASGKNGRHNE